MGAATKCWVEAMRLRTLPVSVAGVLTAIGLAVGNGCFELLPALLCLVFAVLCQIASNFANEYYDYRAGRDRRGRSGPRRGVTEGDITPESMKRATFATLGLAAVVGLCLTIWGGAWLIFVGLAIGLGALAYSTGPYPLSTHCLGEVAVVFFFGIVPVNFTYYLMSLQWSWQVFAASMSMGLMGANVLITNNYRDIPDDKAVGKHTLATCLGAGVMLWIYEVSALLAGIFLYIACCGKAMGVAVAVYVAASVGVARIMGIRTGSGLTPTLGMTSVLMFLMSLVVLLDGVAR